MKIKNGLWILFVFLFCISSSSSAPSNTAFLPNSTLNLDDIVAVALSHQPDLKAADHNIKAFLSRTSLRSADYWPQISLDSDYYRGNYSAFVGPAQDLITSVYLTYVTDFTVSYTLEDFGKRFAQVGEARAQLAQAEAEYHDTKSKVIYNAAEAYFQVLEDQTLENVYSNLQDASEKHLEQAREFVRTGEKPKLELLSAQATYLSDHFNYLKSKQDLANAITHLNGAMGVPNPPPYNLKQDFTIPPFNVDLASAKALAFKIKPLLLAAEAKMNEAQARVNESKADRYPVLTANTQYGWLDPTFPPGTIIWTIGMGLHWNLFDGNRVTHAINENVSLEQEAEDQEKSVRLQIEEDVEKSFRSFQSANERLEVAKDEAAQAQEAFRLADTRYKVGLASFLEVADAHAKLSVAEAHQAQAITDYRLSQSALKRSIGIEEP